MGFIGSTVKRARAATAMNTAAGRAAAATRTAAAGSWRPEPLEQRVMFAVGDSTEIVWNGHAVEAKQGQYIVLTHNPAKLAATAARLGFTDVTSLRGGDLYQLTSPLPVAQMNRLSYQAGLGFVTLEPNGSIHYDDTTVNDPLFPQQWALANTGQLESYDYNNNGVVTPFNAQSFPDGPAGGTSFPSPPAPDENHYGIAGDDVGVTKAWDITEGVKSVVIADLDSGTQITHPDLAPNLFTNPLDTAANGYNGDGYPGDIHGYNVGGNNDDLTDNVGHGTGVIGIIGAAGDNGQGVSGVAPNITILPVKLGDAPADAEPDRRHQLPDQPQEPRHRHRRRQRQPRHAARRRSTC